MNFAARGGNPSPRPSRERPGERHLHWRFRLKGEEHHCLALGGEVATLSISDTIAFKATLDRLLPPQGIAQRRRNKVG